MTNAAPASADRTQKLAASLRTSAARASEASGGGAVLVFAVGEAGTQDLRLRAAAGFDDAEGARQAGLAVAAAARDALRAAEPSRLGPDDAPGPWAAAGARLVPLRVDGRSLGVLALGLPAELAPDQEARLVDSVEVIALRLEQARLEQTCGALEDSARAGAVGSDEEDSEEVLRLSEALFAQNIELLRSHEKLGKIERLKNDFIEKMSRELRTPLNSIIEAIISVLTGEDEALSEAAKSALRSALDEGSAFLRTLQNILDLWRIKQEELPVEVQDVNFPELVDEAIFSVQDAVGDRPLRIETELADPFPRLRTDLAKLNQVLFLLLDNAVKFTPQGRIEIRGRVDEGVLHVAIEDEGVGICHDDQQFVFDEFYQVDESSSQKYRGAGLGLTLVRDLIALLEGEVSIQSDVGRGATVSFSIPVQAI